MMVTRRDFFRYSTLFPLIINSSCGEDHKVVINDLIINYESETGIQKYLSLNFFYPEFNKEPLPLIVFSHGFSGSPKFYKKLLTGIASRGYFIVAPQHNDYINFFTEERLISFDEISRVFNDVNEVINSIHEIEDLSNYSVEDIWNLFFQQILNGNISNEEVLFPFEKIFNYRTEEISVAITYAKEFSNSIIKHGIVRDELGLMGHSLGGISLINYSHLDEDVKAINFISPAGGLTDASKSLTPTIWITGNIDSFYLPTKNSFQISPSPSSFISLIGVGHLSFVEPCNIISSSYEETCKNQDEKINAISLASVCFFDKWIKGIGSEDNFILRYYWLVGEYDKK
ncbi:MAG: hypothetical protein QW727_02075 [Candidatus Pacearchaeota archaeon]